MWTLYFSIKSWCTRFYINIVWFRDPLHASEIWIPFAPVPSQIGLGLPCTKWRISPTIGCLGGIRFISPFIWNFSSEGAASPSIFPILCKCWCKDQCQITQSDQDSVFIYHCCTSWVSISYYVFCYKLLNIQKITNLWVFWQTSKSNASTCNFSWRVFDPLPHWTKS